MKKAAAIFCLVFFAVSVPAGAVSRPETGAPDNLAAWESWALYGHEEQYLCPDSGRGKNICAWPVTLSLDLGAQGGSFAAVFELFKEGRFPLPGGRGAWPTNVADESGQAVAVLGPAESPEVWLPAGRHRLNGEFRWRRPPETMSLPLGFTLNIKIDGAPLDFPPMEVDYDSGRARLWLNRADEPEPLEARLAEQEDSLTVSVNRLARDSQPMMITSVLKLVVSGKPREVLIENALLPDVHASFLSSPLPAQLAEGGLRVKVKPGVYEIVLEARSTGRSEKLGPAPAGSGPEYWAFQAQPDLRLVEISGAPQVDASQADVYPPWRHLPIYVLTPGESLAFDVIRRGDPEPPPDQLRLNRECWLDYDGGGLSCRDRLSGLMNRQWHLNVTSPFTLAQASLGGQPQVITWQTDSKGEQAPGLQLRSGRVDLLADLRIDGFDGRLPASGWDHKLDTEGQRLNLPPGYHLFHASGADARRPSGYGAGSWTASWGTLDFFIILIISIAVWKLYGRAWSLPVLLTLALAYHEPMAPRMIFLHLLATAALLRLLPHQGKARTFIRLWRFCAAAALLVMASVFIMNQARLVLHPQLENPASWSGDSYWNWSLSGGAGGRSQDGYYDDDVYYAAEEVYEADDYEAPAPAQRMKESRRALLSDKADLAAAPPAAASSGSFSNRMVELSQAPDAKVQNSQARPDWRWRQVRLYYNGGVSADQSVDLYLYGPTLWRILGLLRIILMSWFVLAMLETGRALRRRGLSAPGGLARLFPARPMAAAGALLLLTAALFPAAAALAQSGFPDQRLLDEYRTRLLTKKDIPAPGVPRLDFILRQQSLTMIITVEAAERVVLELPNLDREIFQPARVALDGADDLPVVEEQGRRLVLAPAGRHTVTLEGRLKNPQTFQVSFPGALQPRRTVISADPAWQVEGLDQDGQMRGSALLATKADSGAASGRTEEDGGEAGEEAASTNTTLEPFFLVHRTISLGLEWRVHGSARRLTPGGAPVSLKLPLLPGETPLSGNLKLDDGRVSLNFGPADNEFSWESSLKVRPEMELTAGEGLYAESWSLDVSPIWRVAHAGLAPVHNTNNGFWQPTWRPWPGEKLTLTIDRPQPVPGEYLVIDQASLSMTAGENDRNNTLQFKIRASQGGPYSFSLPQGAEVRELKMDGRSIPTAPAGGPAAKESGGPVLTAPLSAGEHLIEVSWVVAEAMTTTVRTPALDLGADCANITVSLTMPEDRWILWTGGPRQGPAVQFWSLLAAVLLFALALAKIKSTPLGAASWFLLGLGLIQFSVMAAMVVGGWLLALGRRKEHPVKSPGWFNLAQISLVLLTLASLTLIYMGIKFGLLQNPDMLIAGGGSYGQRLTWFTDRASGPWPQGYALSSSVWAYKALMLAWSLWLAVSLIKWLRWGWTAFSREGLWQKTPKKKKTAPTAGAPPAAAPEGR